MSSGVKPLGEVVALSRRKLGLKTGKKSGQTCLDWRLAEATSRGPAPCISIKQHSTAFPPCSKWSMFASSLSGGGLVEGLGVWGRDGVDLYSPLSQFSFFHPSGTIHSLSYPFFPPLFLSLSLFLLLLLSFLLSFCRYLAAHMSCRLLMLQCFFVCSLFDPFSSVLSLSRRVL